MSLTSQINNLIANRPKYKISDQYFVNQALARNAAFGRDRASEIQEGNIQRLGANAAYQAQNYSNSTGSLLSSLSDIFGNMGGDLTTLASNEAGMRSQRLNTAMQTDKDLAEEQDKEWNYNVNEPYQMKLKELVDRRKARQELLGKVFDTVASVGTLGAMGAFKGGLKFFGGSGGGSSAGTTDDGQ